MPPLLAGRETVQARSLELLVRTEQFHAPGRSPLILTGVRGVGKTVSLRAIAAQARQRKFIVAAVTATRHATLIDQIASTIAEQLATTKGLRGDRRWHRWTERLAKMNLEVTVAGVVKLGRTVPPGLLADGRDLLVGVLADSAALVLDHDHPGLCVTVDEIQDAAEADLAQLTTAAQQLVDAPLILIGAGLPQTPERLMAAGSFAERFQYQQLNPLTPPEAAAALLIPAQNAGVYWDQAAADLVLQQSQGSPYLVQMYGDAAWRHANPSAGGRITLLHAQNGLIGARHELHTGMFRGRWNRATPAERDFMIAMATATEADGTTAISDIATALGKPQNQISYLRSRLLDKGLITSPYRGRLAFTMTGFDQFVTEQSV